MVKIGIVDDCAADRDNLKAALRRYMDSEGAELDVHEYCCAGEILAARTSFDILYLDIDMPGMSGMELAESIRQTDGSVVIIFCTNLQQFAVSGYKVGALGFLVKPIEWYSFELFQQRALAAVALHARMKDTARAKKILVKDGALSRSIAVCDLAYVEVRKHTLSYVTRDRAGKETVYTSRGSLQALAEELGPHGFARSGASYLVNLALVDSVNGMNVQVGDHVLPIGRKFKDSFKASFSRYLATKDWGL